MDKFICDTVDEHAEELIKLAKYIWSDPEMGWDEYRATEWTSEVLRNNGFTVETGAYNMPTCIRAQ